MVCAEAFDAVAQVGVAAEEVDRDRDRAGSGDGAEGDRFPNPVERSDSLHAKHVEDGRNPMSDKTELEGYIARMYTETKEFVASHCFGSAGAQGLENG